MRKFYLSASHGNISVNSSFVTTEFSGDDFDDDEMSNISNDTVVNEENINKDQNLSSSSSGMVAAYFTPKTSDTSNIVVHSIPVQLNSPINSFHSTDIKPYVQLFQYLIPNDSNVLRLLGNLLFGRAQLKLRRALTT